MKTIVSAYLQRLSTIFFYKGGTLENYLRKEPASAEEGDEVPIAEPLREIKAAVSVGIFLTNLHIWSGEFVERTHDLLDRLVFEARTILDRKVV